MTKKQVESQNCKYFKVSGKKVRYFPLNDEVVWSASGRLGEVCMKEYIWLFPIIFIFHDMEEIIGAKVWLNKHSALINHHTKT